jgi:hypothetical protein
MTHDQILAQLAAGRWRAVGRAIVLHHGPLDVKHQRRVAFINHGGRAVLSSFTAAEIAGLRGWERDEIHVLAPPGTRPFQHPAIAKTVLQLSRSIDRHPHRRTETLAPALIRAGGVFASPRPACGMLAAAVQQRLITTDALSVSAEKAIRTKNRAAMLAAIGDIAMGAQALSEIDFARLCRSCGLPPPRQQEVRRESSGKRRYLDAAWDLANGQTLAVEVDGALHLAPKRWWNDQLRQNEIVLSGVLLLRYPSVVVRHESELVVEQLRRAFRCNSAAKSGL